MKTTKLDRAELVKELVSIRDRIDAALNVLLPDDEEDGDCLHPAEGIEEISEELGDERYKCSACGEVRTVPFNHKE